MAPWRSKPGFKCTRLERTAKEQPGTEKQGERERDLRHDKEMTRRKEAIKPSDVRRFADLLFQVIHQIGPRRFQGRSEAEEQRGDEADEERDRENRQIRPQMHHDGKIHRTKKIA